MLSFFTSCRLRTQPSEKTAKFHTLKKTVSVTSLSKEYSPPTPTSSSKFLSSLRTQKSLPVLMKEKKGEHGFYCGLQSVVVCFLFQAVHFAALRSKTQSPSAGVSNLCVPLFSTLPMGVREPSRGLNHSEKTTARKEFIFISTERSSGM